MYKLVLLPFLVIISSALFGQKLDQSIMQHTPNCDAPVVREFIENMREGYTLIQNSKKNFASANEIIQYVESHANAPEIAQPVYKNLDEFEASKDPKDPLAAEIARAIRGTTTIEETRRSLQKVATSGKWSSKQQTVLVATDFALQVLQQEVDNGSFKPKGGGDRTAVDCAAAIVGGILTGGLTGAAAGSVLPAVGTTAGAFIGALGGALVAGAAVC